MTAAEVREEINALQIAIDRGGHSAAARTRLIEERLALVRLQWEVYVPPQHRKRALRRLAAVHRKLKPEKDAKYAALRRQ